MRSSRVDRAFVRFRATGDAKALAAVFDATAPELLRLARHLSRDAHAAEDLVQSTFLVAIEQARTFAPEREVLPWLCGVLANRARELRRRERVRAAQPGAGAVRSEPGVAVDPRTEAEANELQTTVARALRALPEPYRQVLLLHLEHGLSGQEIAETLARPEPTTRSQIRRGLDLLRAALPAALHPAHEPEDRRPGLRAVRAFVLARAAASAPPTAVLLTTGTGVLLVKKLALAITLLLVACLGLWLGLWLWLGLRPAPAAAENASTEHAVTTATGGAPLAATTLATPEPTRVAAAAPDARTVLDVLVTIGGRPEPGVTVRYEPSGARSALATRSERSDAAGRARFADVPPGSAHVRGDRAAERSVDVAAGTTTTLALELAGVDVTGRVVDDAGQPLAAATVWCAAVHGDDALPVTTTDSLGAFVLRAVAPKARLIASAPAHTTSTHTTVGDDGSGRCTCVLTLQPGATVVGRVVDHAERPVEHATVLIDEPFAVVSALLVVQMTNMPARPLRVHRTAADGTFRVEGLARRRVRVWAASPRHATWSGDLDLGTPPSPLVIQLAAGATVHGRVLDRAGAPAAATVVAGPGAKPLARVRSDQPAWAFPAASTDAEGRYRLEHVAPGPTALRADRGQDFAATQLVLADGDVVAWDARFGSGPRFHGVVVDDADTPLAGWQVQATGEVSGTAVTDALGRFELEVPDARYDLAVVPAAAGVVALHLHERQPGADALRIVVPAARVPSARVAFELFAANGDPITDARIELVHLGDDGTTRRFGPGERDRGRFTSQPLFPGRYELRASRPELGELRHGPFVVAAGELRELGSLRFDVPGELRVRIPLPPGERSRFRPYALCRHADAIEGVRGDRGEDGVVRFGARQPGRYVVATGSRLPAAAREVVVEPGVTTEVDLTATGGVACVLRYPPILVGDHASRITFRDATGRIAFDLFGQNDRRSRGIDFPLTIAPGTYTVTYADAGGRTSTTNAEVRAAEPPLVISLSPLDAK